MLTILLFYIFIFIGIINLTHIALYLVGANMYDVNTFKTAKRKANSLRRNVKVSILIPAHNEEKTIARCLDSVLTSTVRDLEVIVIDDASTDATVKVVEQYIRTHCDFNRSITLLKRIQNVGKAGALNYALQRGVKGVFVMTLDADSVLHPRAIQYAVEYFYDDPHVVGVAANVRVIDSHSILGMLQKFEYMIGYRSKKFYTLSNSEYIVGGVASTYRYSVLKEVGFYDQDIQTEDIALSLKIAALGNKQYKLVYAADVIAMTEGVATLKSLLRQRYRWKLGSLQSLIKYNKLIFNSDKRYSKTLTWYRIPMAFLGELIVLTEPFLVIYIVYLSVIALSLQNLFGAYILITLYLLWNIWPDEHLSFRKKLRMTGNTPVMYFVFYIVNFVQLTAVIRCLINFRQVVHLQPMGSVWISPERSGHAVSSHS
ncbi:glycosyltransferase family 2 protein [Candidatus Saccharibacteria bacterium]|nr:glycosyltransferase family 2 protein [Candidatus Saccharibacteria bacterium]NCU41017.1 glycosyltransferase family 2 protein [Candidatus Saccharibacteria bacterium]